jgi:hypothetical protein
VEEARASPTAGDVDAIIAREQQTLNGIYGALGSGSQEQRESMMGQLAQLSEFAGSEGRAAIAKGVADQMDLDNPYARKNGDITSGLISAIQSGKGATLAVDVTSEVLSRATYDNAGNTVGGDLALHTTGAMSTLRADLDQAAKDYGKALDDFDKQIKAEGLTGEAAVRRYEQLAGSPEFQALHQRYVDAAAQYTTIANGAEAALASRPIAAFNSSFTQGLRTEAGRAVGIPPPRDFVTDVGNGIVQGAVNTVDAVVGLAQGAWDLTIGRINDPERTNQLQQSLLDTAAYIAENPTSVLTAMVQPYADAWQQGRPGEAIGLAGTELVLGALGDKGGRVLTRAAGRAAGRLGIATDIVEDTIARMPDNLRNRIIGDKDAIEGLEQFFDVVGKSGISTVNRERAIQEIIDLYSAHPGQLSGDIATRIQRQYPNRLNDASRLQVAAAQSELRFADDALDGTSILGGDVQRVHGIAAFDHGRWPEYVVTRGDGSTNIVEIKRLNSGKEDAFKNNASTAATQILEYAQREGIAHDGGVIRIDATGVAVNESAETINRWLNGALNGRIGDNQIRYVEVLMADGTPLRFQAQNGWLVPMP